MYVQLAVVSEKVVNRQTAVSAASHALPWIAMHGDKSTRAKALLALGGLLTEAVGKERAKQLLTEAFYDAKDIGSKDMTLMAATYLLELGVNEKMLNSELSASAANDTMRQKDGTAVKTDDGAQANTTKEDYTAGKDEQTETIKSGNTTAFNKYENGEQQPKSVAMTIGLIVAGLLVACIAVYAVWQRHVYQQKQEHSYIEGREEERRRLARELHDGISNQLLAVQMKLKGEGNTEQVRRLLDESREQVRRVSHGLMPPEFAYTTLDEVVSQYIEKLNEDSACDISCHITPNDYDWNTLPPRKSLAIYRIIQESIGNALRHAHATTIAVGIHLTGTELTVTISDNSGSTNAPTFIATAVPQNSPVQSEQGIGLRTMRQWAESIGATIEMMQGSYGHTIKLTIQPPA